MIEPGYYSFYSDLSFKAPQTVKPNRITGEGRMKFRASFYKNKAKDLKKKEHRKMAKQSRRKNRR